MEKVSAGSNHQIAVPASSGPSSTASLFQENRNSKYLLSAASIPGTIRNASYILTSSQQPLERDYVIPILQMKALRLRDFK